MKLLLTTVGFLLVGFSAFSAELVMKSALVPTCYQRSNTAIHVAIEDAERKALENCTGPLLKKIQAQIKPESCGFVQVLATYECD